MSKAFDDWLKKELRRISYKYKPRQQVVKDARVRRGVYKCAFCGGEFGPKQVHVDHIQPVIDPNQGFVDWNTYIERLFCNYDGWQVLCIDCHQIKSTAENATR